MKSRSANPDRGRKETFVRITTLNKNLMKRIDRKQRLLCDTKKNIIKRKEEKHKGGEEREGKNYWGELCESPLRVLGGRMGMSGKRGGSKKEKKKKVATASGAPEI